MKEKEEMMGRGGRTLYVSDMDGTLLNGDSRLSAETVEMLNEVTRRGGLFTVATARTPATVQPLLSGVVESRYEDEEGRMRTVPAIVLTGGALWDREVCRYENIKRIPEGDARVILDTFEGSGIEPFVYCLSGDSFLNVYHSSAMNRKENSFYQERRRLELKRFHLDQKPHRLDEIVIMFAMGDVELVERLTEKLQRMTDCSVNWYRDIFSEETGLMDIYAHGVSKANAVLELKERVGADRVVVFGDNLNDLPMMGVADVAVAVGNALDEVKAQADVVIGTNLEDSVPQFILEDMKGE